MDQKEFTMPRPEVGEAVHFYSHKGAEPVAAFVTGVRDRGIAIWVIPAGAYVGKALDGVKHRADPVVTAYDLSIGFWAQTPRSIAIDGMLPHKAMPMQPEKKQPALAK